MDTSQLSIKQSKSKALEKHDQTKEAFFYVVQLETTFQIVE